MPSRKTRRRQRQYGGFSDSCSRLLPNIPPQTSTLAPKVKLIEEDSIKIATPEQIICYGDAVTSCTTVTLVMEDDWKIGLHMNPYSSIELKEQIINPITAIPLLQTYLKIHPEFLNKSIKYIYVISERPKLVLEPSTQSSTEKKWWKWGRTTNTRRIRYASSLHNNLSKKAPNQGKAEIQLTDETARAFFTDIFGNAVTDTTQIRVILGANIEYFITRNCKSKSTCKDGPDHLFILENGSLDGVSNGRKL